MRQNKNINIKPNKPNKQKTTNGTGPRLAHWILPLPKSKRIGSEWRYAWIPVVAPLLAGAAAGGIYKGWLPQLKGVVKSDTNPFSTNALAATSIEQQVKSSTSSELGALTLGQDAGSSDKSVGKAVKSALGLTSKPRGAAGG